MGSDISVWRSGGGFTFSVAWKNMIICSSLVLSSAALTGICSESFEVVRK